MNSPGIGTAKLENVLSLRDLAPTNSPTFLLLLLVFSPSYTTTTLGHLLSLQTFVGLQQLCTCVVPVTRNTKVSKNVSLT